MGGYMVNNIHSERRYNKVPRNEDHTEGDNKMASMRLIITNIIQELGIQSNNRGYFFIREAIILSVNENDILPVTKVIYPEIAGMFDTSPAGVERAIRHTLDAAWNRGDLRQVDYGNAVIKFKRKPKNSEFISTISDYIKLNIL